MAFNLGLIALFWLLLRFERRDLSVFGISPFSERFAQFLIGLALTITLSTTINVLFGLMARFVWIRNEDYPLVQVFAAIYKTFNSVLFEELIFRAYALYKLHQLFGEKVAVFATGISFGIYHWFTMGVLGNYPMMVWIFFYTGLWGIMFAYCYTRTGSILLATGLHLGWNFFDQIIFNKMGHGLLMPLTSDHSVMLGQWSSFLITSFPTIVFAILMIIYLNKSEVPDM
jgi:membrane protease YdiL (CAAX protease family)